MLKGVQKNFIMIKLPKSLHFEEAYFLMRSPQKNSREGEMIKEANRIISEAGLRSQKMKPSAIFRRDRILFFIYGALSGAASVATLWLGFLLFG